MSWFSRKKKGHFLYHLFCPPEFFLTFVFYLNLQCIEYTFRIYILLYIKKIYFIHFFACLKSSKCVLKKNVKRPCFYTLQETNFSNFFHKHREQNKIKNFRKQVCRHCHLEPRFKTLDESCKPYFNWSSQKSSFFKLNKDLVSII